MAKHTGIAAHRNLCGKPVAPRSRGQALAAAGSTLLLAIAASVASANSADSVNVVNSSFESNGPFPYPGYVADSSPVTPITGWTDSNDSRVGVNNSGGPFAGSTNIPDYNNVGFIQNATNATGTLSQPISGLTAGQQYWFQVFVNARPSYDAATLNAKYGSQTLVSATSVPAGNANYTFINVPFTPTSSSGALTLANIATGGTNNDSTLLLDGISVIKRAANQVVIANPSFEGSQANGVGYSNSIAGWKTSGMTGINPIIDGTSPFGAGTPPDGNEVALLQAREATPASLSQTLPGLVLGQQYTLSFYVNGRANYDVPELSASLGDHIFDNLVSTPNSANYTLETFTFNADLADVSGPLLSFTSSNAMGGSDATVFLDNVSLAATPEPASISLLGLGAIPLLRAEGDRAAASCY